MYMTQAFSYQSIRGLLSMAALSMLAVLLSMPLGARAASSDLEYSGWIPYWRVTEGTKDARKNISKLSEINPFAFSIREDGSLYDNMKLEKKAWQDLFKVAKKNEVRIIPTVMNGNGDFMHALLSNPAKRKVHIEAIVEMVEDGEYDGVDIDYEAKKAETNPYFSLFLKELDQELGDKMLACTIEPRTPLEDRYANPPATMEYANDYPSLDRHCDRVRIMMYDQGRIDIHLNALEKGPYIPLSDVRWVEKVARLAMQDIAAEKIVLAVPTYGYEYKLTKLSQGYRYDRLWSFNPGYATDLAKKYKTKPKENSAGELSFEYAPNPKKDKTAAKGDQRILWWSGAAAVEDKVKLANSLGLRGVAIFKIDGGEDSKIWRTLK
jgi:spore germination protein